MSLPLNNPIVPTARELEILQCIATRLSSKQIAAKLCIAKNTVDNHRKNMLKKFGAKSTYELIASVIRN